MAKTSLPRLKQHRRSVKQSRSGCFTCKERRVKCDESRPSCLRCAKSQRPCDGYPSTSSNGSPEVESPAASEGTPQDGGFDVADFVLESNTGIAKCLSVSTESDRLALHGVSLLAHESAPKLEYLLPQLISLSPCLKEAAAALGATYYSQLGRQRSEGLKTRAAIQYATAIQIIQDDLQNGYDEPVALMLACFLLAVTEVIREQVRNAVAHVRGVSIMFRRLQNPIDQENGVSSLEIVKSNAFFLNVEDQLSTCFQTFTLHISTHAMSYQPTKFRPSKQIALDSHKHHLTSCELRLISALQPSFTWAAQVCKLKYFPARRTSELLIEQGSHIARLKLWQADFNRRTLPRYSRAPIEKESLMHALTLHMICLSALIHVSNVLSPHEVHYDLYAREFQQIVTDAETILDLRSHCSAQQRKNNTATQSISDQFDPGQRSSVTTKPGIIQPLFLTAEKYRHPVWRRRAISCLSRAGLEVPFNGPREAAIAARIVQHEETWPDCTPPVDCAEAVSGCPHPLETVTDERHISESARLNGCVVGRPRHHAHDDSSDRGTDLSRTDDLPTTVVDVSFHRVDDVEAMIACGSCNDGEEEDRGRDPGCDSVNGGGGSECRHRQTWREEIAY